MTDKHSLGGKAHALRLLADQGFPVPPFISVHADELEAAATADVKLPSGFDLESTIADSGDGFTALARRLLHEHESFFAGSDRFAVRSSADIEDSAEFSMAGLFESRMNVSRDELADALRDCYEARHSRSIRNYLALNGASDAKLHLMVQQMVPAQTHAAIVFTANPDGLLNERVLVIGSGAGSDLVSDRSPAITYYRHATEGSGYMENPAGLDPIAPAILQNILTLVEAVEQSFGPALDLELAVDSESSIHLLQMRQITTINRERLQQPGTILDNSNIVESYPGLTLPLSTDFYHQAYQGVFSGLMKRLLPLRSPDVDARLNEISRNMVASWDGRAYYRLHNWLGLLAHLPLQKKIIPVWQDMMGVKESGLPRMKPMLSGVKRLGIGIRFAIEVKKLDKTYTALKQATEELEIEFEALRQKATAAILYEVFFERIRERLLLHWDVTLINDLVAMVWTGRVKKLAAAQGREDAHSLISGFSALESMKPMLSLDAIRRQLAAMPKQVLEIAARDHFVANLVVSGRHPSMQSQEAKELVKLIQSHIRHYGDRSVEELKLESPTQRTNPELLFQILLTSSGETTERQKTQIEATDSADLPKSYTKALKHARRAIERREESRLLRTRVYGMVRTIFLDLAERLVDSGKIDTTEDVFWLEIDEVFAAVNTATGDDYRARIRERQDKYEIWARLPAYSRLIFEDELVSKHKTGHTIDNSQTDGDEIDRQQYQALGSSGGIAVGTVAVVHDVHQAADVKDKILVCRNTDPGWIYLIMQAKGIIAEQGSVLSHTAIIARELGVPAVVGLPHATRLFTNGETVEVDGRAGTVKRLNNTTPSNPTDTDPTTPTNPATPTEPETR